ncbi:hypothetical protein PsYK624_032250 [Phanerochaete sordida]|uniref:Proteasome assembly chaperone 3 n=1 Tax=Phanerochaete sordida TaxID=48140 RepID=A0A9P3G183_9APHY|nr:hypothetical protein PsYK624_032250 [Phanerochaete sordida]
MATTTSISSTSQSSASIEGISTDVIIQRFADRVMVIITQLGKAGTLIEATIPDATPLIPPPALPADSSEVPLPPPPPSIHLTPLLGNAPTEHLQTLHSLYAAQVATLVWTSSADGLVGDSRRAIIVSIALRPVPGAEGGESLSEHERRMFHGIMAVVRTLLAHRSLSFAQSMLSPPP